MAGFPQWFSETVGEFSPNRAAAATRWPKPRLVFCLAGINVTANLAADWPAPGARIQQKTNS